MEAKPLGAHPRRRLRDVPAGLRRPRQSGDGSTFCQAGAWSHTSRPRLRQRTILLGLHHPANSCGTIGLDLEPEAGAAVPAAALELDLAYDGAGAYAARACDQ